MADIIGLSCRFPESNGPSEFWSNLMNGKDMVTADDRRWPVGFQGLPPRTGKLPGFDKFDAAFFSVHGKQAQVSYTAQMKILDAICESGHMRDVSQKSKSSHCCRHSQLHLKSCDGVF